MPAGIDVTLPLPGWSPIAGKPIIARLADGFLSFEGGLVALREVEARLGMASRLAGCIDDPRAPERIQHSLAETLRDARTLWTVIEIGLGRGRRGRRRMGASLTRSPRRIGNTPRRRAGSSIPPTWCSRRLPQPASATA